MKSDRLLHKPAIDKGRAWRYLIITLAVLCLLPASCKTTGSSSSSQILREIPREDRIPLMVINFKNTTLKPRDAQFEPWEFGIPSMLMTDLETIGLFNIISREMLKEIIREQAFQQTGIVDEKTAVEVGRIVAAKYVLTGTFMEMNGTLRIESRLLSVEYGTQLGAAAVTGSTENFFNLEKQLIIEVTKHLGAVLTPEEEMLLAANIETKSIDASLLNYSGEIALFRAKDFKATGDKEKAETLIMEARIRFEQALEHDPNYERARKNLASLTMGIPMTL